jgi:hypothetical protein
MDSSISVLLTEDEFKPFDTSKLVPENHLVAAWLALRNYGFDPSAAFPEATIYPFGPKAFILNLHVACDHRAAVISAFRERSVKILRHVIAGPLPPQFDAALLKLVFGLRCPDATVALSQSGKSARILLPDDQLPQLLSFKHLVPKTTLRFWLVTPRRKVDLSSPAPVPRSPAKPPTAPALPLLELKRSSAPAPPSASQSALPLPQPQSTPPAVKPTMLAPPWVTPWDLCDIVWPGIMCDGCNQKPMKGPRWECLECDDYDLCHACHQLGQHLEHQQVLRTKLSELPDADSDEGASEVMSQTPAPTPPVFAGLGLQAQSSTARFQTPKKKKKKKRSGGGKPSPPRLGLDPGDDWVFNQWHALAFQDDYIESEDCSWP